MLILLTCCVVPLHLYFSPPLSFSFPPSLPPCPCVELPKAAVRILSNVTFLFVSLSYTAESAIVTAFITFIPKFIESQFGIPASSASIYTGKCTSSFYTGKYTSIIYSINFQLFVILVHFVFLCILNVH